MPLSRTVKGRAHGDASEVGRYRRRGPGAGRFCLHRGRYVRSRGLGAGPSPPGHVRRLDRAVRPPPPGVGSGGQLGGRGHGRVLRPHRRDPVGGRRLPGGRQRAGHPDRHQPSAQALRRRDRPHPPARRRQVRRQGLQGLRWAARRRGLGRQRPVVPPRRRGRPQRPAVPHGLPEGRQARRQARGGGPVAPGTAGYRGHVLARRRDLRGGRVPRADDHRAAADLRLPQRRAGDPLPRRARRGPGDRHVRLPQRDPGLRPPPELVQGAAVQEGRVLQGGRVPQ